MIRPGIGLILSCYLSISWATNQMREMEYAEKIKSSLAMGEIVWLQVKGKQFLSLYTQTEKKENLGTVIILHPMGSHPHQKQLINPLRTFLPQHNWATLSMQMPVLTGAAKENEYFPLFDDADDRIQAGIDFLLDARVENIVIVGYGLGGMMGLYFIKNKAGASAVSALVTISLPVPDSDKKQAQVIDFMRKVEQPFLDIFAEFDLPEVVDSARKKRLAVKDNLTYSQLKIKGEGYAFKNSEELVVKRIYSWMGRTFK